MDRFNQLKYAVDQLFGKGNPEMIDALFSDNYIAHSGNKSHKGHKFIKQYLKQIRTAIPDIKTAGIELLSQADNMVTWQRSFSGTHKSILKGIPASGRKVKWVEIVVSRFEENKIAEEWVVSDLAFQLMLKQRR
ncbi:MAG: ester cyclase [Bacteroidota bacterium]